MRAQLSDAVDQKNELQERKSKATSKATEDMGRHKAREAELQVQIQDLTVRVKMHKVR